MSGCGQVKNSMSEMVLSSVFHLQQKNGVSVLEIANYVGEKRCKNPCQIRKQIKEVLAKAKEHGIVSECRWLYRIESKYEDKLKKQELKPKKDEAEDGEVKQEEMEAVLQEFGVRFGKGIDDPDGKSDHALRGLVRIPRQVENVDEDDDEEDGRRGGEPAPKKRKTRLADAEDAKHRENSILEKYYRYKNRGK